MTWIWSWTSETPWAIQAAMVDMIASGDKEGYESLAQATLMGFDVRSRLKEIHVPTTIIHGEKDATVPVALAEFEAKEIPNATVTSVGRNRQALEAPRPFEMIGPFPHESAA